MDDHSSLFLLIIVVFVLILFTVSWCILSTCMGQGIIQGFKSLWDMSVLSARSANSYAALSRRGGTRGEEAWEMDHRFQ